jgi:hypothetical protein
MKKTVKTLVLFTCLSVLSGSLHAQLKLPVSNAFMNDIRKVIADHASHFDHIRGEVITESPQTTEYQCTLQVNGAEESSITRHSSKKSIYSWEAVMLTTESFEKAKQKFKSLYNQLNNMSANLGDQQQDYESPKEEKKFTAIIFKASPSMEWSDKVKLELSLQFHSPMEWKIKVMVYDQERADEERGSRVEE